MPDTSPQQVTEVLRREVEDILSQCCVEPALNRALVWSLSQPGRILNQGKRFGWSILPLLVCHWCGGEWRKATPAAAAIELWLTAGDVFDEVEDRDVPGLWHSVGEAQAVNAGTTLLFLTQAAVLRLRDRGFADSLIVRVMQEITAAGTRSCAGQHRDLVGESLIGFSEEGYFHMTGMRSGALIACACRVGAVLAGSDDAAISAWGRAGYNMGVFAQVVNDVRSLSAEQGAKTDIKRRKKTLPVIYGLEQAEGEDRELLDRVFHVGEKVSGQMEARVREALDRLGAMDYALVVADVYRQKALSALSAAGAGEAAMRRLQEIMSQ